MPFESATADEEISRASPVPLRARTHRRTKRRIRSGGVSNMSDDALFFSLRNRAYELAETGRYKHWKEVAVELQTEGLLASLVERLGRDGLAVMMITRCCTQARS
jgi:hypothetical protein